MADESGAAASASGLPDLSGSRVGRFQVLERLGVGGMGEVYLAEDPVLERRVALKRLAPNVRADDRFRRRLMAEARRASGLTSARIAAMHDVLEEGGEVFLVMEHVEGESLRRRIGKPLPVPEVVSLARQCAEALAAAHAKGILHRDIKPDNLMVTPSGDVKVLDFGVARRLPSRDELATAEATLTATEGGLTGTPSYMAPEELLQREADGRADLFSLGVVLYEALTGEHPFRDETLMRTADRILHQTPPPPSVRNPEVPPALDAVVERLLAKDPQARYATARFLLDDLEELESGLPGSERTSGRSGPLRSPLARTAVVAGMLVVVAGLLAALVSVWRAPREPIPPREVPKVAVLPLDNLTGDPENDHLGFGIADSLITRLAAVRAVAVIPWSEVRERAEAGHSPRQSARDLGATFLVHGGVQQAADTLLVNVRLISQDGSVAWARDYEGPPERLFELHRRLAEGVSSGLELSVTPSERDRLATAPTEDLEAYARFSEAVALLDRADVPGNTERAIQLLQRAIALDPGFGVAHARLGEAFWAQYREKGDTVLAERALEASLRARELDPDDPLVRIALGLSYRGTGRLEAAERELRTALRLQPASDQAYRELARVLAAQNRSDEALEAYQRAVSLRPEDWLNPNALGGFYYRQGRYAEAAAAYRRVAELLPGSSVGFVNLGAALHQAGEPRLAAESLERAVEIDPYDFALHNNLGVLRYSEGDFEAAAEAFERAVELAPFRSSYWTNLGNAHERLNRIDASRKAYERAAALARDQVELNPVDAPALAMLAYLEAKLGRREVALERSEEAVRLAPTANRVLYDRARVLALAGRDADALGALEEAVRHGYPPVRLEDAPDWWHLREHPRFRALVGEGE